MIEGLLVSRMTLAAGADLGAALTQLLFPFVLIILIFYFLVTRPQQQRRRKIQEMLANLKTGDRVLTTGGIYGTIVGFRDGVVQLQVASQVRVDVARSAISDLASPEGQAKAEGTAGRGSPEGETARREALAKSKKS